ncbi:metal-dependent hydrolase [bacterium]|nr:metal-dependent hydrolase [bacterium]
MDFITHSLVGAGVARVINPRPKWLPLATLTGALGSLLMDSDSWLALLGPNAYGIYHRKITHCIVALVFWVIVSVLIVQAVACVKKWRRFGWFLTPNLPQGETPTRAPWGMLILIAAIAAAFHWMGDAITGFGNLVPFFPWNTWEVNMGLVLSFDWFIFGATLSWHLASRNMNLSRKREYLLAACWLISIAIYLSIRFQMGIRTAW